MMPKRKVIPVFLVVATILVLSGCRSQMVTSPEDSIVPVQKLSKNGDIIILLDADKMPSLVSSIAGKEVGARAEKVTVDLTPIDDTTYPLEADNFQYNVVMEGDFPVFVTAALRLSSDLKKKESGNITYYEGSDYSVGLIKPNMMGVSNASYVDLRNTMKSSTSYYDDKLAILDMYDADLSLMSIKPKTMFDLHLGITQPMYEKMDLFRFSVITNDENARLIEGVFTMDSQSHSDAMFKALKTGYVSNLRREKQKLDFAALTKIITQDGLDVEIHDMPLGDEQYKQITDQILASADF